jgi:hypothetical protein
MTHYEHQIEEAEVLALFITLLISSGGNTGSQATTLIIRAMALGELPNGECAPTPIARLSGWHCAGRREREESGERSVPTASRPHPLSERNCATKRTRQDSENRARLYSVALGSLALGFLALGAGTTRRA